MFNIPERASLISKLLLHGCWLESVSDQRNVAIQAHFMSIKYMWGFRSWKQRWWHCGGYLEDHCVEWWDHSSTSVCFPSLDTSSDGATPEVGPPGRLRTPMKSLEGSPLWMHQRGKTVFSFPDEIFSLLLQQQRLSALNKTTQCSWKQDIQWRPIRFMFSLKSPATPGNFQIYWLVSMFKF